MNRYNSGGNHKIAAVEVWNEPHYDSSASTYFTGTAVQMAQIAKTVYSAVKAVDSTVLVLSPGFVGNPAIFITPYLNAAIGDGTYGRAYQDGLAYHWYDFGSVSSNIAYYDFVNTSGAIQASLIAGGLTSAFPIYLTENGWLTSWTTLDSISRAKRICQLGAVVAALGYKSIVMYLVDGGYYDSAGNVSAIYGTTNLIGAPLTDTNVIKAYAWVASLSGQVITEMGYSDTGKVYLNTSVGTVISPY